MYYEMEQEEYDVYFDDFDFDINKVWLVIIVFRICVCYECVFMCFIKYVYKIYIYV